MANNTSSSGKFIVLDGTDGSGKATQTEILIERLQQEGYEVEKIDFPQYGTKSAGLVENYLNGEYGTTEETGPLVPSIFYACDRYDAGFKIKQWLKEGKIVICNRYVASNMAHQGGKIDDPEKRQKFFDWLYKMEYELFQIPKPDASLILHVDPRTGQKLVDQKEERDYTQGKKRDMHENDLEHLKKAEKVYLEIAETLDNFELIECTKDGEIMSKEDIHEMVWGKVKEIINGESTVNSQ